MDWAAAIETNREALRRVLAMLLAMAGLHDQADTPTLPRRLHRAVLRLLRPAEAAARRLVIVAARDIVLTCRPQVGTTTAVIVSGCQPAHAGGKAGNIALPLFDALPRWRPQPVPKASSVPRISMPGYSTPFAIAPCRLPAPDDVVDAARLVLRLGALGRVLDDLPRAARRFARWRAHVMSRAPAKKARRLWPLRPGRAPGLPSRRTHEVHEILSVVHGLAFWALERRDTS